MTDPGRLDADLVERQALELQRRLYELRNERDFLTTRIENLAPWGDFEFPPLETLGGQRLWFFRVPHAQMKDVAATGLRWEVVQQDPRFCYVVVVSAEEPENMPVARVHTGAKLPKDIAEFKALDHVHDTVMAPHHSLSRLPKTLG